MRSGSFFVLGTRPDPLAMYLSHGGTLFGTRIQPMQDQSFYDPLRIGQMLSAVIFKGGKSLVVKPISPLHRFGGRFRFGSAAGLASSGHKTNSIAYPAARRDCTGVADL